MSSVVYHSCMSAEELDDEELADGFPERLRRARKGHPTRAEISQKKLGLMMGYDNANPATIVSSWETGSEVPTLSKRKKLASCLDVEYNWLFRNIGHMVESDENQGDATNEGTIKMTDLYNNPIIKGIHARLDAIEDKLDRILGLISVDKDTHSDPSKGRKTL